MAQRSCARHERFHKHRISACVPEADLKKYLEWAYGFELHINEIDSARRDRDIESKTQDLFIVYLDTCISTGGTILSYGMFSSEERF